MPYYIKKVKGRISSPYDKDPTPQSLMAPSLVTKNGSQFTPVTHTLQNNTNPKVFIHTDTLIVYMMTHNVHVAITKRNMLPPFTGCG